MHLTVYHVYSFIYLLTYQKAKSYEYNEEWSDQNQRYVPVIV